MRMNVKSLSKTVAFLVCVGSTAVTHAQSPQLYPNQKLKSVPSAQVQQDIQTCGSSASQFVEGNKQGGENLRRGARTAARGAAAGALAGTITGNNVGRSTGAGAAVGGLAAASKGIRERGAKNPEYQQYAAACLEDKGYKVVGWK